MHQLQQNYCILEAFHFKIEAWIGHKKPLEQIIF